MSDTEKNISKLTERREKLSRQLTEAQEKVETFRARMGEDILEGADPSKIGSELARLDCVSGAIQAAITAADTELAKMGVSLKAERADAASQEIEFRKGSVQSVFGELLGTLLSADSLANEINDNYIEAARLASAHRLPTPKRTDFCSLFGSELRDFLARYFSLAKTGYPAIYADVVENHTFRFILPDNPGPPSKPGRQTRAGDPISGVSPNAPEPGVWG